MNLGLTRPTNETNVFLLSITKNCETLKKQTHTNPQGSLEFKFNKAKEPFSFTPSKSFGVDFKFMMVLTSPEL